MIFYPSIGNKGYPYTNWKNQKWEYACEEFLKILQSKYENIYRVLRNKYRWAPDVVDRISVPRLLKIYEETVDDFTQVNPKTGQKEFMLD